MTNEDPSSRENSIRRENQDQLVRTYSCQVKAAVFLAFGDKGIDAEAVTRCAFVNLFAVWDTVTWHRQWVLREALNIAHRVPVSQHLGPDIERMSISEALSEISSAEIALALEAIDQLKTKQRLAFLCVEVFGLHRADAAKVLNCMNGTLRTNLFWAKKNLERTVDLAELHRFLSDLGGGNG